MKKRYGSSNRMESLSIYSRLYPSLQRAGGTTSNFLFFETDEGYNGNYSAMMLFSSVGVLTKYKKPVPPEGPGEETMLMVPDML